MSVIIRLQNLPWSANALDIRQYFAGLSIPEGGVHIVGGEQGDAFIAFSTDEDARQAMLIDGGKIKEVKVKLFLSSRAEMQKVIETARQQTLNLQNFMQMSAPQITAPPIVPTTLPVHPVMINPVTPAINQVVPMKHTINQAVPMKHIINQAVPMKIVTPDINQMTPTIPPNPVEKTETVIQDTEQEKKDTDLESNTSKEKRDRRDRSRTRDRSRDRSKSRDRRDYRSRDRDRYRDRRRRERSRSRDRRRRANKDRSRSRERNIRRNTSRERRRDEYERNGGKNMPPENKDEEMNDGQTGFGGPGWMPVNNKPPLLPNPPMPFKQSGIPGVNQKGPMPVSPNVNTPQDHDGRSSLSSLGYTPPTRSTIQSNSPFSKTSQMPSRRSEGFQQNKMQNVGDSMPLHNRDSWPPSRHMHDNRGSGSDHDRDTLGNPNHMGGTSVNERKGMNNFGFHDSRSNFKSSGSDLPYHQSNPRHQNSYGNNSERGNYRQDRSYSQMDRFSSSDRAGQYSSRPYDQRYKPTNACVEVRNMSTATSYSDIRRFFQGLHIPAEGLKMISDCQGNRIGIAYVRFAKSYAKEQALKKNGAMLRNTVVEVLHIDDELFDKAADCSQFGAGDVKGQGDEKRRNDPEEEFQCLIIKDLPPNFKEKDLHNAFSHWRIEDKFVLSKTGRRPATGYVKFSSREEARKALNATPRLMVAGKSFEVCVCDDDEFQDARDRKNMEDEDDRLNPGSTDAGQSNESHPVTQDPRSASNTKYSASSKPEEKKPEKKSEQQGLLPTPNIPPLNLMPVQVQSIHDEDTASNTEKKDMDIDEEDIIRKRSTECVIIRGLPYDANDRDILDFFSDENVVPTQIHIMLDKMGNPAGDAFCEFNTFEEASRALKKSNKFVGRSKVSVLPVSRDEMLDALGVPHGDHSQPNCPPGPLPLMMMRMPFRPPMFPHVQRSGPRPALPNRHMDSMSWPNGFGRPGCVLALENVPFRAEVEEIVDFFRGYGISREQIIRRFDDHGRPTGDARVCLNNPSDAQRALKVLNYKTIRQRPIYIRLAG